MAASTAHEGIREWGQTSLKGASEQVDPSMVTMQRRVFRRRVVIVALAAAGALIAATGASAAVDDEQTFVDLINADRRAAGVGPLTVVPELVEGARDHAAEMRAAGTIYHSDDYGSHVDGWYKMGENVGSGGSVESLHGAFMDSPGHRANILDPAYDGVGVGVVWDGGVPYVVEIFMDSITPLSVQYSPPFRDDDGSVHEPDIVTLADLDVTRGCGTEVFCPERAVTRAEMATMLVRAFELPGSRTDAFSDDDGSVHEDDIQALAAAGITRGCSAADYCPERPVTRAEMATFLVRVLDLAPGGPSGFDDTGSSEHSDAIDALAAAGITRGCSDTSFCPDQSVTRAQMASFLVRAMGS